MTLHTRQVTSLLQLFVSPHAGSTGDLVELLGMLAETARDECAMRLRVEAARSRRWTAVRVITGCTLATATGLALFNHQYLLLLIMVVINFALWHHASSASKASAQEGVRVVRVVGGTAEDGKQTTEQFLDQLGSRTSESPVVSATRTSTESTVEVSASSSMLIPGLSLPVHAVATTPTESFRASSREFGITEAFITTNPSAGD